ncbi:hypothetical protein OOT00_15015 [Desulfobotulus sp. H1]|uniref:Acetyl-CoA hydrolase/transferase family protein n=1 Tax=Desulfobotulus pelophilus TaxID=2823377 RepID=A0ABT3ND06_9BACT|nr:acetyl-CoA hydrolase/transferase C-terminal domain-containing protein [Desulfobotulus pelophilus]MCW7755295.1 hypothetical protein [Desulfobotulus pelophilus]
MDTWKTIYQEKKRSLAESVSLVKSGHRVGVSPSASFPLEMINALSARDDLEGVRLDSGLLLFPPDFLRPDQSGRIDYHAFFMGPLERMALKAGLLEPASIHFSQLHEAFPEGSLDAAILEVSSPDAFGYMGLGPVGVLCGRSMIRAAQKVIVQVNSKVPRLYGSQARIHISEVDALSEVERPLFGVPASMPGDTDASIARMIAERIPNGATLQLGIGELAGAIGNYLDGHRDLGIHSEMLTPSIIRLFEKGVITGEKKTLHPREMVVGFCIASQKDYEFLDDNPAVAFHPVSYVNNPDIIGAHKNFVSVNNALSMDLTGQVSSESVGYRQFSGTGGQLDFVRGAGRSDGGMSFIAMHSTLDTGKGRVSRIRTSLEPGTAITTPRSDVHYVVTEYGIADLKNKSIPERVTALIGIAHPDFRESLAKEAVDVGLIRPAFLRRMNEAA